MRTSTFKTIALTILLFVAFTANANYSKTIYRSWGANNVEQLSIENKFGNIEFVNTRTDSVSIEITVTINNLGTNRAEFLANQINFKMNLSDGLLRAKTIFSDDFKTNQEFSINYTIKLPENKHLEVLNRFGNVTMGDLKANGKFDISYGNLQARDLIAPANEQIKIDIKYGIAAFNNANRIIANVGYGKLNAASIDQASFETEYSSIKVNTIGKAGFTSKYDNFQIGKIASIIANSKFTTWTVSQLDKSISMDTQYGNVNIEQVSKGFENIDMKNNAGNINIGLSISNSYSLTADCYFCEVKHYPGNVEVESNNNRLTIKGTVGEGEPKAKVTIISKYGTVNLTD